LSHCLMRCRVFLVDSLQLPCIPTCERHILPLIGNRSPYIRLYLAHDRGESERSHFALFLLFFVPFFLPSTHMMYVLHVHTGFSLCLQLHSLFRSILSFATCLASLLSHIESSTLPLTPFHAHHPPRPPPVAHMWILHAVRAGSSETERFATCLHFQQ
jgi:hypothetical protein